MRVFERLQMFRERTAVEEEPVPNPDKMEDALQQIVSWSRAYPLTVFPEPDMKKAAELLQAGGITLDAVSASNMRHVIEGVGRIAREGLE